MLTIIFVVAAVTTMVATAAANLMSAKATTLRQHCIGVGRIGIFGSLCYSLAQVFNGYTPSWEQLLMVASLAVIYIAQSRTEVVRQSRRQRRDDQVAL